MSIAIIYWQLETELWCASELPALVNRRARHSIYQFYGQEHMNFLIIAPFTASPPGTELRPFKSH